MITWHEILHSAEENMARNNAPTWADGCWAVLMNGEHASALRAELSTWATRPWVDTNPPAEPPVGYRYVCRVGRMYVYEEAP